MADVHITVDGVPVTVPEGTNVVDAARMVNIAIPVFCYHPRMDAVGMCRMCLVEVGTPRIDRETRQPVLDDQGQPVIAMMPKLQTGCTTQVSEGMVINTDTEQVKFAQNGVLEFLLTSHPLDCPVCDKGGECPLQNLTMGWGPGNSRFDYTDKVHFQKPIPLGDLIYLDRERCILCGRCVRFQEEVAADPVLGYASRGRNWHIISKSDPPFDSKFSGNTTDICPVGALTTADFRFKARVWELEPAPSVCTHCPVGCNVTLDMRHDEIKRVMPRENGAVNDIWICDKGRFGQHYVESDERLTQPMLRRDGALVPVSWDEALDYTAERLAALHQHHGGAALGGLASPRLPNEDLYSFQKLFRRGLSSNNLDYRLGTPGEPQPDDAGAQFGVGRGTNLLELGTGTVALVLGADPEEEAPVQLLRLRQIVRHGGTVVAANPRPTKLDSTATHTLHYRPGADVRVVRALLGAVHEQVGTQHLPEHTTDVDALAATLKQSPTDESSTGLSPAALSELAGALAAAKHVVIMYGADALAAGPALAHDLGSLLLLLGKAGRRNSGLIALVPGGGNTRGALDMGLRPDKAPGYRPLAQPGLDARAMWQAALGKQLRGMYVLGSDPARDNPAARPALEALEFLVVQDMFLTDTARLADVVLPAAAFAERDGTYTTAERRVQRARKARAAPGQSRPDWLIVQAVGERLAALVAPVQVAAAAAQAGAAAGKAKGKAQTAVAEAPELFWDYLMVSEVAAEIAEDVPLYAGITHEALAKTGTTGTWGRQTNEAVYYDGTNYENSEGVGVQYPAFAERKKATFSVAPLPFEQAMPDAQYPLVLLTQPLLYDDDALLRDSRLLEHVPAPYAALSPAAAERLGLHAGDQVQVRSAAGALDLPLRTPADMPDGALLIPAGLHAAPLSALQTGPHTCVAVSKRDS